MRTITLVVDDSLSLLLSEGGGCSRNESVCSSISVGSFALSEDLKPFSCNSSPRAVPRSVLPACKAG